MRIHDLTPKSRPDELASIVAMIRSATIPVDQIGSVVDYVGSAAIYTKHMHHVAIMRKILLRMVSWQNYVFGELH